MDHQLKQLFTLGLPHCTLYTVHSAILADKVGFSGRIFENQSIKKLMKENIQTIANLARENKDISQAGNIIDDLTLGLALYWLRQRKNLLTKSGSKIPLDSTTHHYL